MQYFLPSDILQFVMGNIVKGEMGHQLKGIRNIFGFVCGLITYHQWVPGTFTFLSDTCIKQRTIETGPTKHCSHLD